jgi:CheY-like chemotaxis protein
MKKKLNCILLIDDDDDDNYFHQIIINRMNITEHIEVVLNGEEALIFLKKEENQYHPDIIFLDINMPKMNGWEFMEAYKELRADQKAKVLVIMLTTSESPEDKKRVVLYPEIIGFNSKPLTQEMLIAILEKYF